MVRDFENRPSNTTLLNQLDVFDQNVIFGDAAYNGKQTMLVKNGTVDREFTANTSGRISIANQNTVNVQTLES